MDCRVCPATGDMWLRMATGGFGSGGRRDGGGGGFSQESEHDLGMMVSDFMEYGSSGPYSIHSSDSDSGLCDLAHLADKIHYFKLAADQYERDLVSVVNSLMLSIEERDLQLVKTGSCNTSCIRLYLVKLLRFSGYDAGVCVSKWQGSGKVPGGDHEYVDVVNYTNDGRSERFIIDLDFRSHFEIARAVESYDRILSSLPTIYVGSFSKLNQYLQVMVDAARSSLKQNSMPLPPWRSLTYLQAKWQSPYERKFNLDESVIASGIASEHKLCRGHLRRLQSSLQSDVGVDGLLKPISNGDRWLKPGRRWHSSFRIPNV